MNSQLYTAASGLLVEERRLELISNNLANLSTSGFRAQRLFNAVFNGIRGESGSVPAAANQGVALGGSYEAPGPGPLHITGRALDIALAPGDFLEVLGAAGPRYTRAGALRVSTDGELVDSGGRALAGASGKPIDGLSAAARIEADGSVADGEAEVGRLRIVRDPLGLLRPEGNGLYRADGNAQDLEDADEPLLIPEALEGSATDPLTELVHLIEAQRAFESYQKLIGLTMNEVNRRAINEIAG